MTDYIALCENFTGYNNYYTIMKTTKGWNLRNKSGELIASASTKGELVASLKGVFDIVNCKRI